MMNNRLSLGTDTTSPVMRQRKPPMKKPHAMLPADFDPRISGHRRGRLPKPRDANGDEDLEAYAEQQRLMQERRRKQKRDWARRNRDSLCAKRRAQDQLRKQGVLPERKKYVKKPQSKTASNKRRDYSHSLDANDPSRWAPLPDMPKRPSMDYSLAMRGLDQQEGSRTAHRRSDKRSSNKSPKHLLKVAMMKSKGSKNSTSGNMKTSGRYYPSPKGAMKNPPSKSPSKTPSNSPSMRAKGGNKNSKPAKNDQWGNNNNDAWGNDKHWNSYQQWQNQNEWGNTNEWGQMGW